MIESIFTGFLVVAAGVFALWGARHKMRADRAKRQIDDYQKSSDKWQSDAAKRVEEIKRAAAGKAPIDPKNRRDFE